ncbi:uncharacterized protein LOC122856248 [Aphidius gifuensis]|uniref:uncharacterized protein LOC122856248 n=1 Tax=Aphidius gifuensis TaxID=684658 RepID=UPI001CDD4507|nr:uncharacterized protein LOC122856248 [Aphidius gifuensis]
MKHLRYFFIIILLDNVNSWSSYRKNGNYNNVNGCSFKKCKKDEFCVIKKFWCKNEPCPYMLYCAKSQQESLKGPASCDSVTCSKGHICSLKIRQCTWGKPCQEQYARCITDYEFYEGPASCAGYKCSSSGNTCILRESLCPRPPCRLLKSCSPKRDVHAWLDHCNSLDCLSEHECFMRKPDENCQAPFCKHKPDCIIKNENELIANEKCRGWICPKNQQCVTQVVGPCQNDNCKIIRSCVSDVATDNEPITKDWNTESSRRGSNLPENNHQDFDLDDKQTLILFLEKLNEERNSYLNIINQTQKLISESQSVPVNIPQLDLVLENHTDKIITTSTVKSLYNDLLPHLRLIPPNEREMINQNDKEKSDKIVKFSDNDEVTFIQDDNHNLTYPKIYIKVENNMNSPIKLGNVRMKYHNADDDDDNYDDNDDDNNGGNYHDLTNHHVEDKNNPSTVEIQRKNNSPLVITTKENSSVFRNNNVEIKPWKKLRIKGKIGSLLNIKPDYFKRFPNLEVFDIHTGKISLKPNLFQAVNKTIKKLYLTINDNSDSLKNAFAKLDLLDYLEIYNSSLEYIKHDTFDNITNGLVDLKLPLKTMNHLLVN